MEISERRSSRTKTVKRLFEIETKGCSKMNNKPTSGVKMKGGAPSGTTTDFVTPKSIKRSSNGEVQTRKVMSALHNLGNTCFLNSVLQVLYHTPQFQDKITLLGSEVKSTMLALDLLQQLNYDGLDITRGIGWSLVSRLSELLKQMEKIDKDIAQGIVIRFPAIRPYNLLETIEEISPEFKGNQQQDAHELLKCVLMNIDEASNELNTSRSKLKLCIGNRSREINLQDMVKNLDSNAKKLQTNALLFEANNHATSDVDLKNNSSVLCDDLKNELQEDEDTSFRATDGCNLLTSDVLSGEKWTLYRGMKRKYGQFDCDSDDHLRVDEDISMKLKPSRVANTQFPESQVSLIRLSPLSKSQLHQQIVQNCCIHLHRFDSPLGMNHANFATQAISNLVTEMFQGMMSLKTKCLNCMKETERKEEFQDISLPIRKPTAVDSSNKSKAFTGDKSKRVTVLQLILSILDEVERLDGENCYYCESCQLLVTAERRLCYELLPNILTIHLKRFAMHSSSSFTKTFDRVDIPLELPCLESNCRSQGGPCHRYSLYGIVCHAGKSVVSGHYTSYVRVHPSDKKGSRCSSLSQSRDKRSPNALSPDDGSVVNRISGDMQRDSDTSLDTSGQAGDSVSHIGAQSSKGSSFTNGCVTMHDISLVSTSGSRSEPRNSVMPDLVSSSKDPVGHSRSVGRPRKRKMRHSIQTIKCAEPEVNTSTSVSTETDLTLDSGDDSLWYKCNDDVITEMTKQQLASLLKSSGNITPYMLFYHKVSLPNL